MNLLFWKHKKGAVIKQDCYDKLPATHKSCFSQTEDEPTHYVDNTDYLTPIVLGSMLNENDSPSIPIVDDSPGDSGSQFGGFGGGDFGGGGSSADWDSSPSDTSSFDAGSSMGDSGVDTGSSDSNY